MNARDEGEQLIAEACEELRASVPVLRQQLAALLETTDPDGATRARCVVLREQLEETEAWLARAEDLLNRHGLTSDAP